MKKYVKPVMVRDEIEMNQAIAACTKGKGNFSITWKGWGHADCGGYSSTLFKTYQEAVQFYNVEDNNHRPVERIAGIYYVTNGTCKAYYEDFPAYDGTIANGLNWGGPSGEDNWQWVEGASNEVMGTFVS